MDFFSVFLKYCKNIFWSLSNKTVKRLSRILAFSLSKAYCIIALLCEKLPFMAGADFTPEVVKVLDSKKVSDHHAIIPTMELAKADPDALPESEKNILTLAGARLLLSLIHI